jgi:gliding motility-associated-like protein
LKSIYYILLLVVSSVAYGQHQGVWLHPNRGQWEGDFSHKIPIQKGAIYINKTGITYHFYDIDLHHKSATSYPSHVVQQVFINAQGTEKALETKPSSFYANYFLGNDASKWRSDVHAFQQVELQERYPGIHLQLETTQEALKYSWIVLPGADITAIKWRYDGADNVAISKKGQLKINHSLGSFTESKPVAWVIRNGKKIPVACSFIQKNKVFSFDVKGTDFANDTLIIDPSLTFSTFSGATTDNWGFTAAPDNLGNLYAGGISFGIGYPVTTGAFDLTFNGGVGTFQLDASISKFNANGTNLIYSTYLGGAGNETPHSIVTDAAGDLFILGVTSSANFPLTGTPFDATFNGGPSISENSLSFDGADIYIARLNAAGTQLVAATYLGGSGTDGINTGSLNYNYGDQFRGEIIVDQNSVYISSVTKSTNFPTQNPSQAANAGGQDAVVVKLNKTLNQLIWSTYFGGTGDETGNGIQLATNGNVYVAGGTTGGNLNFAQSGHDQTYDGARDAYLVRFSGTTGTPLSGTYIGTTDYDQAYFVQIDNDDDVYVYGQTAGNFPITQGCYGSVGSGQFIAKYNTNLTSRLWITTVGAGTGNIEISPTAFLVSNCKEIYISGWGGDINQIGQAFNSSSFGFPVTSDAYQATTNGSNFWIAVLGINASFLKYATFFGGSNSSSNHVDGGTSRFDKNGNIYHAVCGGCGGNNFGFTTTPGVWSQQNPSPNCNLAAFKFELSSIEAIVNNPAPLICIPDPVVFQNNSANGNSFFWDFGDGTTSTLINPSHVYAAAGQYIVSLLVTDTNNCYASDSLTFVVNLGDFQGGVVQPNINVCLGQLAQLEAFGGATYLWSPAQFLSNANIANPIANVTQNTNFICIISDSCGIDTVSVQVQILGGSIQLTADTSICLGSSVPLTVQGIVNPTWSPIQFLSNPLSLNPIATPTTTTTYIVSGNSPAGCFLTDTVTIQVFNNPPLPQMPDTIQYCEGTEQTVTVSGAQLYSWAPNIEISTVVGPTVTISSTIERYYYCNFTNSCGTIQDSLFVDLIQPTIIAGNDTIVCPGDPVQLFAAGGVSYVWNPVVQPLQSNGSLVQATPFVPTNYQVIGIDQFGCVDSATVAVNTFPVPFVQTTPDVFAIYGEQVQLGAIASNPGILVWTPPNYLSCDSCANPIASPYLQTTYTVTLVDQNGCSASDNVTIYFDPLIYVPNTFTPNDDPNNRFFLPIGTNIDDFRIDIYNRWGEIIFTAESLGIPWDGTYKGKVCQDGVYGWKIRYSPITTAEVFELLGHVTLLR